MSDLAPSLRGILPKPADLAALLETRKHYQQHLSQEQAVLKHQEANVDRQRLIVDNHTNIAHDLERIYREAVAPLILRELNNLIQRTGLPDWMTPGTLVVAQETSSSWWDVLFLRLHERAVDDRVGGYSGSHFAVRATLDSVISTAHRRRAFPGETMTECLGWTLRESEKDRSRNFLSWGLFEDQTLYLSTVEALGGFSFDPLTLTTTPLKNIPSSKQMAMVPAAARDV